MQMHKTRNDLPEANRRKLAELLNARLVDSLDLMTQAKQAHWNVKGPHFKPLHELFDEVATLAAEAADDFAERAVELGAHVQGTARVVAQKSSLTEYPLTAVAGRDHVEALSAALATFGKGVRAAIDASAELRDADTADLFTEYSREADKKLWMLEAHLQSEK